MGPDDKYTGRNLLALCAAILAGAILLGAAHRLTTFQPTPPAEEPTPPPSHRFGVISDAPKVATLVVPTTASTTTLGASFSLTPPIDRLGIETTIPSLSASTLDVYVQGTFDGTNWLDVAHFTQVAGGGGTLTKWWTSDAPNGNSKGVTIGTGTADAATVGLAAGDVLAPPFPATLRLVSVTGSGSNAGTSTVTATFFNTRVSP
jgi:hypothetical protein